MDEGAPIAGPDRDDSQDEKPRKASLWIRMKGLLPFFKKTQDSDIQKMDDLEAAVADSAEKVLNDKVHAKSLAADRKADSHSLQGAYKGHIQSLPAGKAALQDGSAFKVSMRTIMQKYTYTLEMQSPVAFAGWSNKGVFFNIINRGKKPVRILDFEAGAANGGNRDATMYVCKAGACSGNETDPGKWYSTWHGRLMSKRPSLVELSGGGVVVEAGKIMGFFLHSATDGVCYSRPQQGAKDTVLEIEPWFATAAAGEACHLPCDLTL